MSSCRSTTHQLIVEDSELIVEDSEALQAQLEAAAAAAQVHAMKERALGILVTQTSFSNFTIELSRAVPYEQTMECRNFERYS
ncbi:hypothetical protein [Arthrobacter sp. Y81]|uniref:hypothetical protein n=1 Tax=Arthrobacter sp. Y81 TaxID=2058897 RepID=UPI000CE33F07|nr:hypothetical protein [Arthrobacter sp. Y81]